ncbi:tyrosine-type recombinase/integrase [Sphingomonas faeni]|nr:tyrosine-type recombinase/integrase [Sphingomonas faeni]
METATTTRRKAPATVLEVNAMREPGRYSVGDGLLLVVNTGGSRSWLARVRDGNGRRRDIGLGRYPEVTLKEARDRAAGHRKIVRDGLDPVAEKRKAKQTTPTFKEAATSAHDERKAGYKNEKHAAQWLSTLKDYAFPAFGALPVDQVTGPMIVTAMKKIWLSKPETARRTLQRIGTVISWATAHGFREHDAPMQAIRMGLPPQPHGQKGHAAIPYKDAAAFVSELRAAQETNGRNALLFLILTAARSGEARGARWDEIDLDAATWTVPAERIKMAREHVVPLSASALALVKRLHAVRSSEFVFASYTGKQITDAALSKVMRDMGSTDTVHGWRSAFRDWGAEETNFPSEVLEKALAHQIANAVERAYRRGDLLDKRRQLMDAWAAYLDQRAVGNVVPLKTAVA